MEPDEVEQLISAAWAAVEKAGVAPGAQEAAFQAAIQLLSMGQLNRSGAATTPSFGFAPGPHEAAQTVFDDDEADLFAKIAKKLEVSPVEVAKVYTRNTDGGITIDLGLSKLPQPRSKRARHLVLLLAAAHQAITQERQTEVSLLRPTLEDYDAYDTKNFKSAHLKGKQDWWKVVGDGDAVRVLGDGIKAAGGLVRNYAGAGE